MTDMGWLATEAKNIHDIFNSMFYGLVTVFLLLGVFLEYFKWPLGGMPSFGVLIGRALVAMLLLHTYPEVTNALADVTDGLAQRLGDLNQCKFVLAKMGDKLHDLTWNWISIKEGLIWIISFFMFFVLYFSFHIAGALLLYTWTLLYVFSPLLIACYVLPVTSAATTALYRSLIEACCWKIVWSVLATLVWSAALSDMNKPGHDISFLSAIYLDLMLGSSLLMTPIVVHALAAGGVSSLGKTMNGVAIGATVAATGKVGIVAGSLAKNAPQTPDPPAHLMNSKFAVSKPTPIDTSNPYSSLNGAKVSKGGNKL